MIVVDTETTGLIKSTLIPLPQQPHIIEFAAVKLDEALEPYDTLTFRANPGVPLDKIITDITGLTDADLVNEPPFSANIGRVVEFFLGERVMAAYNCAYDRDMMSLEMRRLNRLTRFPWPPENICTVEATYHLEGHRLKMTELYMLMTGRPLAQKHRALDDVTALVDIIRVLRERQII
jgi:DNA polymerase III epsilon subunit-like protein